MAKLFNCILAIVFACVAVGCNTKQPTATEADETQSDSIVTDSAWYGICGEATSMHSLQLVTDEGRTLDVLIDPDSTSTVLGGLLVGDRVTVTCVRDADGQLVADRVVNLTTLLGHWTSLDRNFRIMEDGTVSSNVSAESKPYTAWSMVNANLILNADTFAVASLGADSMMLENNYGIFVYKRVK